VNLKPRNDVGGGLQSARLFLQAQPSGRAAHHEDIGERSAIDIVAGRALKKRADCCNRATPFSPCSCMLSIFERLHNVRRIFKQRAGFAGRAQRMADPSWRQIRQVAQEQEEGSDGQRGD
jgi:hypothetical protein